MVDSASPPFETFFVTGVGLVSSREELPAETSAPERLAWHLLRAPATAPGAREFARASRDPRAQRNTAAYLLDEAIRREIAGGKGAALEELWMAVDEAWRALAGSAGAAAELSSLAESLGIAEPEAVARTVLGRISTELLPGLHGLFAVQVKAFDSKHMRFHLARMGGSQDCAIAANCIRAIEGSKLAMVRDLRKRVNPELILQYYLDVKISDAIERGRLSTEVAELVTKRLLPGEPGSYSATTALLAKLEAAASAFPWDHRIHLAVSQLHLRCGILSNDQGVVLSTMALHLAKAAAIDPSNRQAEKTLETLKRDLRALVAKIEQPTRASAKLNSIGERNLAAARKALRMIESFADSAEGQALLLSHHEAFWGQLALRLGLDPSDGAAVAAARALVDALTSKGSEGIPFSDLRERLVDMHPMLASAPWTAIEEVFTTKAPITAAALTVGLPPPPILDEKTKDQAFIKLTYHRLCMAAERRRPVRRSARSAMLYPWLFSSRDKLAKAAVVIGVACMTVGAVELGVKAWDADRRDTAYDKLHAAVAAQRPAEVISAAQQFIAHTHRGFNDYRVPDVVEAYRQALLQEITRTATAGPDQELSRLLDSARALKAWAPSAQEASMEGSTL